jgi:signal transduction histidine kinase
MPPEPAFAELDAHVKKLTEKTRRLQNILQKLTLESETKPKSISERVHEDTLEQLIRKALSDKDILIPFEFAVYSPSSDSNNLVIRSQNFKPENLNTEHRITLFPNDLITKPNQLLLFFPGQKGQILRSLALLMTGSIIFTLVIVLSSGASIVVMIRQKKISDIKTDFINNMTHEFKTPIATISIAADSIINSRVIQEPDKIRDFTRIIKEENNRMNTRVEQVLQMALLDSRDFKLRPVITDMHAMIERAVNHYRLQIEKREGVLSTRFDATNSMVEVDEDHMRNVLMNLLDNANKYSGSRPEINVFTFNRGEKFFFGVEDHGTGMSQETQRRVFDKFFRVTSGNIHNVKGFGLGLSYVKAIVLAHHGDINLQSEVGKGSRFEISLAYIPGHGEKVVYEGLKE